MSYPKPWKSYADQLDQLMARGICVTDRELALDYLERIGYYRLSGYWYPLLADKQIHQFKPNSTFEPPLPHNCIVWQQL